MESLSCRWSLPSLRPLFFYTGFHSLRARAMGLASTNNPGLLIVGASAWTVGLAEALRRLGVLIILVNTNAKALLPARLKGLMTV